MASYAYYCVVKFKWAPSKFYDMNDAEKGFVIACINKYEKDMSRSMKK